MTEQNYKYISDRLSRVPNLIRHSNVVVEGFPKSDWITFNITPLKSNSEVEKIIADIYNEDRNYYRIADDGSIIHEYTCELEHNTLPLNILNNLNKIVEKSYDIAIWDNNVTTPDGPLLKGQPVVFAVNPEINHYTDKYHPHINTFINYKCRYTKLNFIPSANCFCPESICYEQDIESLGNSRGKQILAAFDRVASWLVKYELWKLLVNDKKYTDNPWIGKQHYIDQKQQRELDAYLKNDLKLLKARHEEVIDSIRTKLF